MAKPSRTVLGKCRFCLGENGLVPISKAVDFEFTIHDVERYSGVKITEDEQLYCAICDRCCQIFESTVELRLTSLRNNDTFKFLFSAFIEGLEGDPIATEKANGSISFLPTQSNADALAETNIAETNDDYHQSTLIAADGHSSSAESDEDCTDINVLQEDIESNSTAIDAPDKLQRKADAKVKSSDKPKELCNICGRLVSSYKEHSFTHTVELKFDCPYCPKKFVKKRYQKLHVDSFHKKKIIRSCEICGKGFTHRNSHTTHMVAKHGIGKKYECTICFKSYNCSSHYTDHFNKTHSNQEYPCTICGRIFKSKYQLQGHKSVHSDDQPYACSQCPKRFKKQKARKTHELTHTGIRFACKLCEKSYGYKALLSAHYRKDHDSALPSESEFVCSNT